MSSLPKRQKVGRDQKVFHDQVAALHEQQRIMVGYLKELTSRQQNPSLEYQIQGVKEQLRNIIEEEDALRNKQISVDAVGSSCWNNLNVLDQVFRFVGDGSPSFEVAMISRVNKAFNESAALHPSFWSILDTSRFSKATRQDIVKFSKALNHFSNSHGSVCERIIIQDLDVFYGTIFRKATERTGTVVPRVVVPAPPVINNLNRINTAAAARRAARSRRSISTTWICGKCPGSIV